MNSAEAIPHGSKRESGEKRISYNFESIESIESDAEMLVRSLKRAIDSGEYDTLIGDDASGRIPTLVLWNVMKERVKKMHPDWSTEKQREASQVYFVAGGRTQFNSGELSNFFDQTRDKIKKKALLVTEYVQSGKTIYRLAKLLEDSGIPFDVAALRFSMLNDLDKKALDLFSRHKIFKGYASPKAPVPRIYGAHELSGVFKSTGPSAHSVPLRNTTDNLEMAREDAKTMAEIILKRVWDKSE
jgi:hypothetical protein